MPNNNDSVNQPTPVIETRTNPDPSTASNEAITRSARSERDFTLGQIAVLKQRLDGMDEAAKVLSSTINRVPTEVQKEVTHVREVFLEKFESVDRQFTIAEAQRLEQKADAKTGLDAALSAQKEAAAEQNKSNTLAITKSENGTVENIKKLEDLFTSKTQGLSDKIDDVKTKSGDFMTMSEYQTAHSALIASVTANTDRLNLQEGRGKGMNASWGYLIGAVGLATGVISTVLLFAK